MYNLEYFSISLFMHKKSVTMLLIGRNELEKVGSELGGCELDW